MLFLEKVFRNKILGDNMETLGDKKPAKTCSKFCCEFCDYYTSKKSSFTEHLSTDKHKKRTLGDAGDKKPAFLLL